MATKQEGFWKGEFGDSYIDRNNHQELVSSSTSFFSRIIQRTKCVNSIIEFGCNIGINLVALNNLLPGCNLTGVEINPKAAEEVRKWGGANLIENSILDLQIEDKFDLTFTKGVLIHINPEYLNKVYKKLYDYSSKYILIAEYYNPTPTSIKYRGYDELLFKRDFAGEIMDIYEDLELVDYGFIYHRDPAFPQDDISWFLLKKI